MNDVEIIIQPDGSLLIPRGTLEENIVVMDVFGELTDKNSLESFLSVTSNSELLFGNSHLCG